MDPVPASSALEAHAIANTPVKATSRTRVFNIMMLSPVGIGGAVELHQSLRAPDPLGCLPPRHSRAIVDYRSHPSRTKSVTLLHFAQVKDALSLSRRAGVPLSLMNKPSIFFSFVVVWIATAAVGQASAHPALVNSQATNCRSCHTEVFQQRPVLCEPAADDCSSRHEARIEQCTRAIDRVELHPPLGSGPCPPLRVWSFEAKYG